MPQHETTKSEAPPSLKDSRTILEPAYVAPEPAIPRKLRSLVEVVLLVPLLMIFPLLLQYSGWPLKLEMAWNGMDDFVEDRDGNIYVALNMGGFRNRVLRYSADGEYLGGVYFPVLRATDACLASDSFGGVYLLLTDWRGSGVYRVTGRHRKVAYVVGGESQFAWRLSDDGVPEEAREGTERARAPNRLVQPGELLFNGCPGRYRSFESRDGGMIYWYDEGWRTYLELCDPRGRCRRLNAPAILQVCRFPFPAIFVLGSPVLLFVVFMFVSYFRDLWRSWKSPRI